MSDPATPGNVEAGATATDRYARQKRFAPIGADGQERLRAAQVLVIGGGALGAAAVEGLTRAGVGNITIVDRDLVEDHNLHRQGLFTEADADQGVPKAAALAKHAGALNRDVTITPIVSEAHANNLPQWIATHDLVIDGTDNFRTRHQINDACYQANTAWIYGGCVGAESIAAAFVPGHGPGCFRCLQGEEPPAGSVATCQSAGVILPAVWQTAAWQLSFALQILTGHEVPRVLRSGNCWTGKQHNLDLKDLAVADCPTCGVNADYPALHNATIPATVMCGREAVQINLQRPTDLTALAASVPAPLCNEWLVRWSEREDITLTAFADGRVLVQGVASVDRARALVDRWLS
jgi:adenylyltransferase/sulfurtransferase